MTAEQPGYSTQPAMRATILCGIRDRLHHRSLVVELVQRARRARLAGATVFEGVEGYGEPGSLHARHLLADDSPASIVLVDRAEQVEAFLHANRELLAGVMVTLEDVEVVDFTSPADTDR